MGRKVAPPTGAGEKIVDLLEGEWRAIASLGDALGDGEWGHTTGCPGWSVRDVLSHLIGTERSLLGEPAPVFEGSMPSHVKNKVGEENEAWVAARRGVAGGELVAEWREVTARRLQQLRGWHAEQFAVPGPSPVGEVPYREFMAVRVMDCWVHEQDIRLATSRARRYQGEVAAIALARLAAAVPYVIGKKASAPEGSLVHLDISDSALGHIWVGVQDGRAAVVQEPGRQAQCELRMNTETFWRLACGRVDPHEILGSGQVRMAGDVELGNRVVENMPFMI